MISMIFEEINEYIFFIASRGPTKLVCNLKKFFQPYTSYISYIIRSSMLKTSWGMCGWVEGWTDKLISMCQLYHMEYMLPIMTD